MTLPQTIVARHHRHNTGRMFLETEDEHVIAVLPEDGKFFLHREAIASRLVRGWNLAGAARAIIAAGRPHYPRDPRKDCLCAQCIAWDELKSLLEETP